MPVAKKKAKKMKIKPTVAWVGVVEGRIDEWFEEDSHAPILCVFPTRRGTNYQDARKVLITEID